MQLCQILGLWTLGTSDLGQGDVAAIQQLNGSDSCVGVKLGSSSSKISSVKGHIGGRWKKEVAAGVAKPWRGSELSARLSYVIGAPASAVLATVIITDQCS